MKMIICLTYMCPEIRRHLRTATSGSHPSVAREMLATCGGMILGSDSHTRYGALGTMAIGEGGGDLANNSCFAERMISICPVVGIYLTGEPMKV